MENNQQILVGAVGWAYPHWRDGFFPDDLPEDWMLSYYNTQFQAVYLPAKVWKQVTDSAWAQWLSETRNGFFFVLEPADSGDIKPVSERILLASAEWEKTHIWWLDESPDLRALAQRITQQAAEGKPLFVFSRTGNLGLLQQANSLKEVMGY